MAVATGTAALIGAGIAGLSQTGGAALASRANNRATEAQARATREAMQYQREQEWRARMDARHQYDAWRQRYYPNQQPATAPAAVVPATAPSLGAPAGAPSGMLPGPVAPTPPVVAAPPLAGTPQTAPQNMADLAGWSAGNYRRYLGQGR